MFNFPYVLDSQPVERFVQIIEMKGQGAAELENSICTFLEKHQIKLCDCRGQSYDNGSNMSGKYIRLSSVTVEANHMIMDQT